MNEVEKQILLNQYVIMVFLHGTHLGDLSSINEVVFDCLRKCIKTTGEMVGKEDKQNE